MADSVSVENVAFAYDEVQAVDHISFNVEAGEILGFLGPNGAGKTTTVKMLTGILPVQEGRVDILGMDITEHKKDVQSRIGVCFEEKNLYEEMSAVENLKFFASLYGVKGIDADVLLERVGLPVDRKDRVSNYSKGMKQRLMMARTLVNTPAVMFLDEPTDGLDPVSARTVRKLILEEKERGAAVVLTTHDMMEADILSDKVAFINEGKIVSLDTPDNLKHEYGKRVLKVRFHRDGVLTEEEIDLDSPDSAAKTEAILENYDVMDMHTEEATLEDIFIQFTGRRLE